MKTTKGIKGSHNNNSETKMIILLLFNNKNKNAKHCKRTIQFHPFQSIDSFSKLVKKQASIRLTRGKRVSHRQLQCQHLLPLLHRQLQPTVVLTLAQILSSKTIIIIIVIISKNHDNINDNNVQHRRLHPFLLLRPPPPPLRRETQYNESQQRIASEQFKNENCAISSQFSKNANS